MSGTRGEDGRRSRSLWSVRRFLLPNFSRIVGVATIRDSYRLIRSLWSQLRIARGVGRAMAGFARPGLSSDIAIEAALQGLSPSEFEARVERRRSETRRSALFGALLGTIAFGGWAWNMVMPGPVGFGWVATSLEFLPFGAAALLHAFYNGWMNWQLRRRRRGSAMEYLTTDEGFWPS